MSVGYTRNRYCSLVDASKVSRAAEDGGTFGFRHLILPRHIFDLESIIVERRDGHCAVQCFAGPRDRSKVQLEQYLDKEDVRVGEM
jgi:hypothetical protein